ADAVEGDVAAHLGVLGFVDAAHTTLAENIDENITVGDLQEVTATLGDFLDLERGEPAPAVDFLGHRLKIGLFVSEPAPEFAQLRIGQQPADLQVLVERGRRVGGTTHRAVTGGRESMASPSSCTTILGGRKKAAHRNIVGCCVPLRSGPGFRYVDQQHPGAAPMPTITVNSESRTFPDPITV